MGAGTPAVVALTLLLSGESGGLGAFRQGQLSGGGAAAIRGYGCTAGAGRVGWRGAARDARRPRDPRGRSRQ